MGNDYNNIFYCYEFSMGIWEILTNCLPKSEGKSDKIALLPTYKKDFTKNALIFYGLAQDIQFIKEWAWVIYISYLAFCEASTLFYGLFIPSSDMLDCYLTRWIRLGLRNFRPREFVLLVWLLLAGKIVGRCVFSLLLEDALAVGYHYKKPPTC